MAALTAFLTTSAWAFVWLILLVGWGHLFWRLCRLPLPALPAGLAPLFWTGFPIVALGTFGLYAVGVPHGVLPFSLLGLLGWWKIPLQRLPRLPLLPLFIICFVAALHLLAAAMPPIEADSLAYHFAIPKLWAEAGTLVFRPIAVDFAVPLLTQSGWTAAYTLGGERALMALAWLSSLMAALMAGTLARRVLPLHWSTWVTATVLTLPVFSYGFTTGTVELRLTGLMALTVWALLQDKENPRQPWFTLVALGLGGMIAMKVFGLFSAVVITLLWLSFNVRRPWPSLLSRVGLAAVIGLLITVPFYAWLWVNSGSPLFPLGCNGVFTCPDWSVPQQGVFADFITGTRNGLNKTLLDWLWYPWKVTLDGALYDNTRTGLGPLLPMLTTLGALVLWLYRPRKGQPLSPVFTLTTVFFGFFILWFFVGASTKTRHLLPVVPLVLIAILALVHTYWHNIPVLEKTLLRLGVAGVFGLQLLSAAAVSFSAIYGLVTGQSRQAFIEAQVPPTQSLHLLNNLKNPYVFQEDIRMLNYYFPVRYGYGYAQYQATVPLLTGTPAEIWQALRAQDYTHWLIQVYDPPLVSKSKDHQTTLIQQKCLTPVRSLTTETYLSRVLKLGRSQTRYTLYALTPETCPY